ncbi:EAL domain-containing protein [Fluoribacter gormanii]|uniref:cyclic-guanylate-specific phosphodiesterase n=1 Tax=Fluoribacter gormanii TaxID=464 RepID=A0A377GKP9_9GAMM|nr:EAL domain-containing protein [Fluoribacter gormanii]KTD04279.1 regulatory protein (GGDEF domain) [Fluoribacter gormanii]SIR74505.1 response regulator receiver modulated diguanylate cyclase/phosphodiesterase [Fluoribacter gormanii]STO25105.1 Cyclic di-GMP phosphodiesterase Gmr [Fluoribacter gormanii]
MSDIPLHIMIIDDNPSIHQDFIKVLTASNTKSELNHLDKQLFDDDSFLNDSSDPDIECFLPKFIFTTACQGQEAIIKIKENLKKGIHYALAFVDIRMPPGWDGIETIKHMWEVDPDIQVVICTAYSDYSWEDTVKELGIGDNYLILKKPFDVVAVRQLACALTRKWILANDAKHHEKILQQTVKERTESLQQSLSLLRSTFESSADGILVIDLNNKLIDCNSKFISMWNIPQSMLETDDGSIFLYYMLNQLIKPREYLADVVRLRKNMDEIGRNIVTFKSGKILECYTLPHRLNEKTIGRVWSFRDITEQANLEKQLKYQALHDPLTQLPNRALLIDRIQASIDYAQKNEQKFAILYFDLDRFKLINDSLSHEVGDQLLRMVGQRWSSLIRKEDTLARLGGDEFVMICHVAKNEDISAIGNKILDSMKKPFKIANRDITITPAVGICIYPKDGKTPSDLLKSADLAMYQAKERGGNQYYFYATQLHEYSDQCFKFESDLRNALKNKEFFLLYQPQFNLDKENLLSVEALIRWNHPEKGLLLPLDFIPIAEETGIIIPMGEWIISEACQQIKAWHQKGLPYIRVAINITTRQLQQPNFIYFVEKTLKEYLLDPQYVEFEISENVIITHRDIVKTLNQLKQLGIKIALDDFGTGNSSINYLKQLHIDCLKIDQSFIQNISASRSDEVIIEAIISMARSFNFKVIAEGVESQKQLDFLKQQHCDEVQGFFFSKPLTSAEIEQFLKYRG